VYFKQVKFKPQVEYEDDDVNRDIAPRKEVSQIDGMKKVTFVCGLPG
jgi:hypothetical protein